MARWFIFLEITDPDVNMLLSSLRHIFTDEDMHHNIHITLKGPLKGKINRHQIESVSKNFCDETILLAGTGIFKTETDSVVYIRARNDKLWKVWLKPDYPRKKYGFNPHVTLYKGRDGLLANKIYEFLNRERIELLCRSFKITPYLSKQTPIFSDADNEKYPASFERLIEVGKIQRNILERAKQLMEEHENTLQLPLW